MKLNIYIFCAVTTQMTAARKDIRGNKTH